MKTIIIQSNTATTINDKEFINEFLIKVKILPENYANDTHNTVVTGITFIDNNKKEEISVNLESKTGILVGHPVIEPIKHCDLINYNIEMV